MKKTNVYTAENKGEVLADTRKQAAALLHVAELDVRFVKQTNRTELQRLGDHCARTPLNCWDKKLFAKKLAQSAGLLAVLFCFAFTSCTTLDIDGVRGSFGAQHVTAASKVQTSQGSYTDKATDTLAIHRAELVNKLAPDLQVGLLLGLGAGSIHDVDVATYDIGGSVRQYFGDSALRPYGEATLGYRRFEASDDILGRAGVDMLFGSASIGLELSLGSRMSLFAQGGYEGAFKDDLATYGPSFLIGGAVSF